MEELNLPGTLIIPTGSVLPWLSRTYQAPWQVFISSAIKTSKERNLSFSGVKFKL
jgi:hypothetical protein